jgi:hypothetical protein
MPSLVHDTSLSPVGRAKELDGKDSEVSKNAFQEFSIVLTACPLGGHPTPSSE